MAVSDEALRSVDEPIVVSLFDTFQHAPYIAAITTASGNGAPSRSASVEWELLVSQTLKAAVPVPDDLRPFRVSSALMLADEAL